MNLPSRYLFLFVVVFSSIVQSDVDQNVDIEPPKPSANAALLNHQTRFSDPEIIRAQDNIYVAHGFDMSNIIFIEGPEGLVVMDTGFRVEKARLAIAAIREITDKPIVAVIYSHGHGDHVGGSAAFKAEAPEAEFIAYQGWQRNINYISSAVRPVFSLRAFAQLGLVLPPGLEGTIGSGGGPVLRAGGSISYVPPTMTVTDGQWLEFAGLRFQVLHTPGDLDDGLSVWFPSSGLVLTGDTVTDSHVHTILSTPRHEPNRDAQAFVDSMTRIESLNAQLLIGGHGDVVQGRAAVRKLVREDRRTAQFMIDEVVRHIRQNRSGEWVQSKFKYPDWFMGDEERGDYYHRMSWIARGVYAQYMGWFSGDATSLSPVAPEERAQRIVQGFGGTEAALQALNTAYAESQFAWSMELASYILALEPENLKARQIKSWSLKSLAYSSGSANERNYLLTQAMMLEGKISLGAMAKATLRAGLPDYYGSADAIGFLHTLGARLDVEAARETRIGFRIELSDRDEHYFVEIDRGVILTSATEQGAIDFTMTISHENLAVLCEGLGRWDAFHQADRLVIEGDAQKFRAFSELF